MTTMMEVVKLMRLRRFGEAAGAAQEAASTYRRLGFRQEAIEALAAAAKCHQLAGQNDQAVARYSRVFADDDHQLEHLPSPDLILARLASWPERYARAAMAAADAGDPVGALSFAETGRFRVLGQQLAPARDAPDGVAPELWTEYVRLWRGLAATAANRLVSEDSEALTGMIREKLARVRAVRGRLREAGLSHGDLNPSPEAIDGETLLSALPDDTQVLYTVVDQTDVRFLSFSRSHAAQLDLSAEAQRGLVLACRRHRTGASRPLGPIQWRERVDGFLDEVRGFMEPVFRQCLSNGGFSRLLWIPHGILSLVPIAAVPFDDGVVLERTAVMVAPSLSFAHRPSKIALEDAARAARGGDDGRTSTVGGDSILKAYDEHAPAERKVDSLAELLDLAAEASVLLLTCHGDYSWDDPLSTSLVLGGDARARLHDIIDSRSMRRDQLVLLGACDAGTISQAENNEALGIPTALLIAGASTVIGAQWPVARPSAAALCLQVLRGLRAGLASPEAVRDAALWLRQQNGESLAEALDEVGHPVAPFVRKHAGRFRVTPHDWGAFVHWGGVWRRSTSS